MAGPVDEGDDVGDDDPWDSADWDQALFDEAFIRSASVVEPSAEERIRQQQRRVRVESLYQRMAERDPSDPFGPSFDEDDDHWAPRPRPPHLRRIAVALLAVLMIGAVVRLTGALGTASPRASAVAPSGLATQADVLDLGSHRAEASPSASAEEQSTPIGTPPSLPTDEGPFTFLALQADGRSPMAYDPCRPIHYVVNPRTEPANGQQLIDKAIAETSRATGLKFIADGPTVEKPSGSCCIPT